MLLRLYTVKCKECGQVSENSVAVTDEQEVVNPDDLVCRHYAHASAAGACAPRDSVALLSFTHRTVDPLAGLGYSAPEGVRTVKKL